MNVVLPGLSYYLGYFVISDLECPNRKSSTLPPGGARESVKGVRVNVGFEYISDLTVSIHTNGTIEPIDK